MMFGANVSRTAMTSRASAARIFRRGTRSNRTTAAAITSRSPMAPKVPRKATNFTSCSGNPRQASADHQGIVGAQKQIDDENLQRNDQNRERARRIEGELDHDNSASGAADQLSIRRTVKSSTQRAGAVLLFRQSPEACRR